MEKYRNLLFLLAIIVVGIGLRIYQININYYFSGELGKELLYIRHFALNHSLPVIGMATSHEWLNYGPIYYWIMIPIFNLGNGDPFILFWSALVVSVIGLVLNYFVFQKIADTRIAILSTLIQAISPLMVWQTRASKLHVFFWIIIPIFTYGLYMMWQPADAKALARQGKWVFWTGLVFGILFSFHFSQIPLLGMVILLFWIKKKIYKVSDWIEFGLGVLIPNLTLIWQDKSLALWLPYRVLNIENKNPGGTIQSLIEYFGRNIFWNNSLWIVGLIIFILVFGHYLLRSKFSKEFLPFYLISSILLMLVANILHGAPPVHYFLPIFTIVPVLFAVYLNKNVKVGILLVLVIFVINFKSYFKFEETDDFIPYAKQIETVDDLITKAQGKEFSINRVGPYDYFPENYSQNYKYLVLWKGGRLIDNSNLIYTIDDTK